MQYVRSFGGSVSKTWNSINPATLSGAIDVIVVEQEDGRIRKRILGPKSWLITSQDPWRAPLSMFDSESSLSYGHTRRKLNSRSTRLNKIMP